MSVLDIPHAIDNAKCMSAGVCMHVSEYVCVHVPACVASAGSARSLRVRAGNGIFSFEFKEHFLPLTFLGSK